MIFTPLTLPNGQVLPNRIAKAAMEENMAAPNRSPSQQMLALYHRWSVGGTGLLITGNVMVDGRYMTGPGNVVLENDEHLDLFKQWASKAKSAGNAVWMQISHPGRQTPSNITQQGIAPSAVDLDLGKYSKMFAPTRAMEVAEIEEVIERFVTTAVLAEKSGFDGVEVHAAHGYLISQFLSPLVNKRTDQWGGSIENRARLLLCIIDRIREEVRSDFAVAVKLNSADFQRGGFEPKDAKAVVSVLEARKVDMVELSGGSYEAPAMQGSARDDRTLAREAYFVEFAKEIANSTSLPIMTTGGISRRLVAENVLEQGIDMVGIATGLALVPELPKLWQQDNDTSTNQPQASLKPIAWKNKTLAVLARMAQVRQSMQRHSVSTKVKPQQPYWLAIVKDQWLSQRSVKQYKSWRAKH